MAVNKKELVDLINEAALYPLEMRIAALLHLNEVTNESFRELTNGVNLPLATKIKIENYLRDFNFGFMKVDSGLYLTLDFFRLCGKIKQEKENDS